MHRSASRDRARAPVQGGARRGMDVGAAVAQVVGAFVLADNSADCAMLLTLNSGAYTIQVSGVGGASGNALVEVYAVPSTP